MNNRLKNILLELYKNPKSKDDFINLFKVSSRTIADDIAKYNKEVKNEEIIYDINIRKYRFDTLLPKKIPSYTILQFLENSIGNSILNDDYKEIIESIDTDDIPVIDTDRLSPLFKNIIMVQVSFVINAVLKIDYVGLKQKIETKWIRPRTLINVGNSYYLNALYDDENHSNAGEERSFSLIGIQSMEIFKIEDKEILYKDEEGNAWGLYKKDQYITLKLKDNAASFFKREKMTNKKPFEFISEGPDGSVLVKMFYNKEQEIIQIIQKWMPNITLLKNTELSKIIYSKIKENFVDFSIQQ
ncbi:MAG: WYL domain-containing protein [Sulfurovaceae bacterium]